VQTGTAGTTGEDLPCPRDPAPADRDRSVVVSKPYDQDSNQAPTYQVLGLSTGGVLSVTDEVFEMRRTTYGTIEFLADGEIGVVAQADGSVGMFRVDDAGSVTVLDPGFGGDFYASSIVMDTDRQRIFVLDTQTADNGGGIYEIAVDCDDTIREAGLVLGGDLVYDVAWRSDGSAFVGARGLAGASSPGHNAFLIDGPDAPSILSGVDAFGDDQSILAAVALVAGGQIGLLADNSAFSGIPNRIAVVTVAGDELAAVQVVPDLDDPYDLVGSPLDDTAIMVSGFGDAVFVLDIDPTLANPVTVRGELAYTGAPPQLPGHAVMLDRGSLTGLVLLAENTGVRRIQFEGEGVVTDLGVFDLGDGVENIVGAIGVQP
jgi:hypothetical protein